MRIVADGADRADAGLAGRWWTLAAVCLGTFMLLLDISVVYVALPGIQRSLGASQGARPAAETVAGPRSPWA